MCVIIKKRSVQILKKNRMRIFASCTLLMISCLTAKAVPVDNVQRADAYVTRREAGDNAQRAGRYADAFAQAHATMLATGVDPQRARVFANAYAVRIIAGDNHQRAEEYATRVAARI